MTSLATAPMCAHCVKAKAAVIETRAENASLRRQVHELKAKQLRHDRSRSRKRVEKRTAQQLVDQLEFTHGLDVVDLGHGRWRACCPAHADSDPSLQVTEKSDGQILIHCWTGCLTEQVLESIGWEFAMLRARD